VVYLHPGCSFFFESFLGQPRGLVQCLTAQRAAAGSHLAGRTPDYQLADEASALLPQDSPIESADAAAFEADSLLPRRLPEPLAAANERLWQQRWTNNLQALADQAKPAPHPASPLLTRLRLTPERNLTVASLGSAYSRSLNDWGVELQRLGRWTEAGVWFHRAFELSPDNLAARINLEYNQRCAQGDKAPLDPLWVEHQFPGLFEKHSNWRDVIEADGPLDEPASLFRAAHALLAVRNNHQAARDFARCAELAPDWLQPKLWLAQTRLRLRDFPGALDLTDHLMAPNSPQDGGDLSQLLYCRATALRALGRTNEAAACIEGFLAKYRAQEEILLAASELYSDAREFESELALLDELLERGPNRADLLVKKGLAQMQLSKYDDAIATLTKALALAPSDSEARLYRAVACLRAGQLEAARGDYLELLHKAANPQPALFGLGGIAWRQHDTNVAIGFYQQFLSNALQGSVQYTVASKRLERLKKPGMDAPAGPGAQPRQ
jgi:tetratricopeptide (TPR) repeat protein